MCDVPTGEAFTSKELLLLQEDSVAESAAAGKHRQRLGQTACTDNVHLVCVSLLHMSSSSTTSATSSVAKDWLPGLIGDKPNA